MKYLDALMAFLMKNIGGFFDWWEMMTRIPTIRYEKRTVNYSMLAFFSLVIVLMVAILK